MTKELFFRAVLKFISGIIIVGLLIFIPAGTIAYWNGWLFMGILFIPILFTGVIMIFKNPGLLEKRLYAKEKHSEQRSVIILSFFMFLVGFVSAGLSFRFNWLMLPTEISISGAAVFLIAYLLYAEVLRENTYLSRTIEVQKDQIVIDTGFYRIVRHPMYSVTIILFLTMPLILGSLFSFAVFLVYPFIIAIRIKHEELLLEKELMGYREYQKRVKYKLMPFIW